MSLFEHPLQLYTLEHPDDWEVRYEEDTGGVTFVNAAPGDTTALRISPLAMTGRGPTPLAELQSAAERVGVALDPATLVERADGDTETAAGEGDRAGSEVIGSRFRFWVLRHGTLTLFATQLGPGAAQAHTREAGDALIGSVAFPEIMPPTIDEFRARVLEILQREYPQVRPTPSGQWSIDLQDGEGQGVGTVGLENLYRDCLLKSESAGAIIRDYLDQLVDSFREASEYSDYDTVRDRLLPMLKSEEWTGNIPSLATAEFAPGLRMCFTIDSPTRVAFVTTDMLADWDVPLERVEEVALDNLARKGPVELMVLRGEEQQVVAMVVNLGDGYDATRLASQSIRESLAEELGDEFLVGLPNRDFLIAFNEKDPETAAGIIRQVKHDYQRMNHPLTDAIYRVRPDRVELTEL